MNTDILQVLQQSHKHMTNSKVLWEVTATTKDRQFYQLHTVTLTISIIQFTNVTITIQSTMLHKHLRNYQVYLSIPLHFIFQFSSEQKQTAKMANRNQNKNFGN